VSTEQLTTLSAAHKPLLLVDAESQDQIQSIYVCIIKGSRQVAPRAGARALRRTRASLRVWGRGPRLGLRRPDSKRGKLPGRAPPPADDRSCSRRASEWTRVWDGSAREREQRPGQGRAEAETTRRQRCR
jgi:hypothetical protein